MKRIRLQKSGVTTLLIMVLIIASASSYFFLRNKSALQKRNNTSAAQALLIDDKEKSFTDLEGKSVSVNNHFGKIMVVMSWASWCPQCTTDLQELGKVAQEYSNRGVVVMAVNRAEDKYSAQRYLATISLPSELTMMLDPDDHYFKNSDGYAMPETVIFSPNGSMALHEHGELQPEEVRKTLDDLLKK
jgi:thiol-disulfide isomerase/thioredoxin